LTPEAVFKQNQLIVNINARITPKFNLSGFYNLTCGQLQHRHGIELVQPHAGLSSAPASPRRNMVFLMGNYTGPFNITFNPFLIAQSGRPYNFVPPTI
jgi:hypothetical protein